MQVQADFRLGGKLAHRTDAALDLLGARPPHGVGQVERGNRQPAISEQADGVAEGVEHAVQRHRPAEIAAPGG